MRLIVVATALILAACGATTTPATTTTVAAAPATTTASATSSQSTPVWDPASAHSWDRNLIALMPQIDACRAQAPYLGVVSYAGRDEEGVLVVMHGEEIFDCHVSNRRVHIAPHTSHPPGDGDAEFVRAPGPNPGGECYTAPEVHDANGNVLGWMLDPEGC